MEKWSPRGLIGVVHLPALPGDPCHDGRSLSDIVSFALTDAGALIEGGVDALILENFGSAPFPKGTLAQPMPPHHAAIMTVVGQEIRRSYPDAVLGINCLRNDGMSALGIAVAVGAQFIRVNILTGAYVTDQGLIEGDAYSLLRYRQQLGASHIAILADVLVKHAAPLAPLSATDATKDTLHRGMADGIIVTGSGTGEPVDSCVLSEVFAAAEGKPVLLGSGVKVETLGNYVALIQGAIVGTALKFDGSVSRPVDISRVRKMAQSLRRYF
ncbi:MAG: BtpA/SgcQ family protein [Proteobacteria bacterium]|nr:BtpA/SgcQ family protein [Pseudomonadota bacterium]